MRVALVQMHCRWGRVDENLKWLERFVWLARDAGAEVALFPELTATGIYKDNRVWDLAEDLGGASVRFGLGVARSTGLYIGFGFTERAAPLPYNAYCVADPDGQIAGVYRKNFVAPLETPWWQDHSERPVFDVAGRRCAVSICWDNVQPELLAEYGRRSVDVVIMPHAWDADPLAAGGAELPHSTMAELYEHHAQGRLAAWRSHDEMRDQFYRFIPERARENNFYALFVNQAGQPHPAVRFAGPTFAVDRNGRVIAETTNDEEQIVVADLE